MSPDELDAAIHELNSNRVMWTEVRAYGASRVPFTMIGDWNGLAWEFAECESYEVSWHEIPSTPALIAKAGELAGGRVPRRAPGNEGPAEYLFGLVAFGQPLGAIITCQVALPESA